MKILNVPYIRHRMKEFGLSNPALAKKAGLSAESLSSWLGRRRNPRIEYVAKMAKALYCNIDDITEEGRLPPRLKTTKRHIIHQIHQYRLAVIDQIEGENNLTDSDKLYVFAVLKKAAEAI